MQAKVASQRNVLPAEAQDPVITSTTAWCSATTSPGDTSHLMISPSAVPSPMSGSLNFNVMAFSKT